MKLAVARRHSGLGDWLFSLAALRWLRFQHPDVEIVINFANAPSLAREAFAFSDLSYTVGERGDVRIDHLVYDYDSGEPYLNGMARVLSTVTQREVVPSHTNLPSWEGPWMRPAGTRCLLLAPSWKERAGKEWGAERWRRLAQLLIARHVPFGQIGAAGDELLPGAAYLLGARWLAVLRSIRSAAVIVCPENGLSVLAGFLGAPQLTVYAQAFERHCWRMSFDRQTKIGDPAPETLAVKAVRCLNS